MDKQNVVCTCSEILFSLGGNPLTCYNMDEPCRHYAKWNKPGTKGQALYDSTSMKYLEKVEYLSGAGGEKNG